MTNWYRLDLGNGLDAHGPTNRIQKSFTAMLLASGEVHPEWAIFSRYDTRQDNIEIYFTPALRDFATNFGAYPCEKPAPNEYAMGLLNGESNAVLFHFPEHRINQR